MDTKDPAAVLVLMAPRNGCNLLVESFSSVFIVKAEQHGKVSSWSYVLTNDNE